MILLLLLMSLDIFRFPKGRPNFGFLLLEQYALNICIYQSRIKGKKGWWFPASVTTLISAISMHYEAKIWICFNISILRFYSLAGRKWVQWVSEWSERRDSIHLLTVCYILQRSLYAVKFPQVFYSLPFLSARLCWLDRMTSAAAPHLFRCDPLPLPLPLPLRAQRHSVYLRPGQSLTCSPAFESRLRLLKLVPEEEIQGCHAVLQGQRQVRGRALTPAGPNTDTVWLRTHWHLWFLSVSVSTYPLSSSFYFCLIV